MKKEKCAGSRRVLSSFCTLHSAFCILCLFLSGCIFGKANPAVTAPVTQINPKEATPDFWWNQPGVTQVHGNDFQKLWDACKGELYVRLFTVDREQYRNGLLSSEPMVSKQFFEPWRTDAVNLHDVAESSLATIRRTVRFEVRRRPDGSYDAVPKVLVERYASTERRLTTITQFRQSLSGPRPVNNTTDQTAAQATDYWYAVRRDTDMEKDIAASINRWMQWKGAALVHN